MLTTEQWFQPPIQLVDENGNKIKLRLRRMTFEREIDHLPADLMELHNLLATQRANQNENKYMMVAAWCKFKRYHQYWKSFHFQSEQEYLAYYDLPEGTTLGQWEVMVNLFDKTTFNLLGDVVLSWMIRLVAYYQSDTDERKKDYQAIFDQYCRIHEAFDKTTFFRTARNYVADKYEKYGVDGKKQPKKVEPLKPGTKKRRITRKAPKDQQYGPRIERDFDWRVEQCGSCTIKVRIIEDFIIYVEELKEVIRKQLGEKAIPGAPPNIRELHL